MNVIAQAVQKANADYPAGCPSCKGIRYKRCLSCGGEINSFSDHRARPRQLYETRGEWREVNGEPNQTVPDRRLQP